MKGKQLSLQEVLNLEDGRKVWVEDSRRGYTNELCSYKKEDNILLVISDNTNYILDVIGAYDNKLEFYEWIEEEEEESTLIMYGEIIESMANEIARHRYPNKYEYDDKLIESIIEEFMEEK